MLSRRARNGLPLRPSVISRPAGTSFKCSALQVPPGRRLLVTRLSQPWPRDQVPENPGLSQSRRLATAIEHYNPLQDPSMPPYSSQSNTFDPSAPLMLPDEVTPRRLLMRTNRMGIPGHIEDMISMFNACVRVGKLDRAALVISRLDAMGSALSPEEQILINNRYLRACLEQIRGQPGKEQADSLHKWYELHIRKLRLPQTAETIACMLKASLLSDKGTRLKSLIKRYMSMAPGEAGLQVLNMSGIFTDRDLAIITQICPTYNLTEDADVAEEVPDDDEVSVNEGFQLSPVEDDSDLKPTPQKGIGLVTLKRGLSLFASLKHVDVSKLSHSERHRIQLMLERDSIDAAIHKWKSDRKNLQSRGIFSDFGPSHVESSMSQNMACWLEAMEERLEQELQLADISEQKSVKTDADFRRCLYGPFLRESKPERLSALTILSVLNLGTMVGLDKGVTVNRLINTLARLVQEDIKLQRKEEMQKAARKLKAGLARMNKKGVGVEAAEVEKNNAKIKEQEVKIVELSDRARLLFHDRESKSWSQEVKAQVGSILLKILLETAKIKVTTRHPKTKEPVSQYQPAFMHVQQPRKGKKVGVFILNASLTEKLRREPVGDYITKHLPMLVEPKPWTGFEEGAFLASSSSLVRVASNNIEQVRYSRAAIETGDMLYVLKGLNVLGKTAWRINDDVYQVMMEAWNSGEEVANIPPLDPKLEAPPEPDPSADPVQRLEWIRIIKGIQNKKMALHSQRCYMNLQLEIARSYRKQTMYFPHNVDYRGRAYPMPTYLNHMGADHVRGLLRFAKGKELGVRGLRWLKIHLANVYGLDKSSFDEREAFTNENVDKIIESATNPLKGSRWWLEAEDPWQTLGACFELKAALESPDPTKYVSYLPVHQDGTCNGLQHYAALGGDTWGAKQVNLEPGDRPADVYSAVAELVKKSISEDAAKGEAIAKVMEDKVTRKVVKQTVMTNVYGVTFSGAKKQVCKQIDALYPGLGKQHGTRNIVLATYVARHTFKALATMFKGAHDIQHWLGDVGGRVCRALTPTQLKVLAEVDSGEQDNKQRLVSYKAKVARLEGQLASEFRSTIVWTTPLRMPVVQPYRKSNNREIRTCLQAVIYSSEDPSDPVNRRKQLQGFPPNFIHSLDASHMILSALQCDQLGLTFAAVHDSFWTHAADVDTMNNVLRDCFIQIHQEDVIGRLAAEFKARHDGSLYVANIKTSSVAAKKIRELRFATRHSMEEELLLEYRRTRLMSTGKPEDLAEAKKILTPAAVYEAMQATEVDVSIEADKKDMGIGEIPETDEEDAGLFDEVVKEVLSGEPVETTPDESLPGEEETPEPKKKKRSKRKTKKEKMSAGEAEASTEMGAEAEAGAQAEAEADVEAGPETELQLEMGSNVFAEMVLKRRPRRANQPAGAVSFWMPLKIPPIPEKVRLTTIS
ncbi:hypothetical protein CDD80_7278 [Ophiocordyceps camponoti-rufipedis]|uniref:DNA-directed RNA polymerase n=1 Tax=Ophiocordyceps camponoti-rufipedis TaxID=2004952 RepID=A0A2C5YN61_9HYPO|nr:hypothetical protein CDD80_7278 [Ophiocordyceps camponoti-rufipedis]